MKSYIFDFFPTLKQLSHLFYIVRCNQFIEPICGSFLHLIFICCSLAALLTRMINWSQWLPTHVRSQLKIVAFDDMHVRSRWQSHLLATNSVFPPNPKACYQRCSIKVNQRCKLIQQQDAESSLFDISISNRNCSSEQTNVSQSISDSQLEKHRSEVYLISLLVAAVLKQTIVGWICEL